MNHILERIDNTVDNIIEKINLNDAIEKDEQIIENELIHLVNYIQKSDTSAATTWFYPNPKKDFETITITNPDGTTETVEKFNPIITNWWNNYYKRIPKSDIAARYEWLCILLPKCPAYVIKMIIEDSPDNPQHVTITCDDAGLLVEIG